MEGGCHGILVGRQGGGRNVETGQELAVLVERHHEDGGQLCVETLLWMPLCFFLARCFLLGGLIRALAAGCHLRDQAHHGIEGHPWLRLRPGPVGVRQFNRDRHAQRGELLGHDMLERQIGGALEEIAD